MNEAIPTRQHAMTERERVRIVVGVLICMLLAALDQTIVAPVIPAMSAALGGSSYISWIVSAYFLAATATTPLYGKIADIHGRRPTLFAAAAIFVAGSIVCALAPSMGVLICGRAVQGLGGGGLMALAQTVIGDLYPPRERGKIAGYIAITWATASIAGPMLGGFITEHLSWPVIFWLNLPLAGVALMVASRALTKLPWQRREHRLDTPGALLVMLTTIMFLLALALAPQPHFGWSDPTVLGLVAAGLLLAPLLARHMLRTPEPLIPLEVLGNRIVLLATSSLFFGMAASIGLTVFVPLFLELALGLTPSQAGLGLVAYMVGTVIGANFAGRMMGRVKHYKRLPVAGLALSSVALAWLAARAGRAGLVEFEAILVFAGMCSGQQFPTVTVSVQNAVDPRDIGVATGVLSFMRALGSSIGVAVFGAVAVASGIAVNHPEQAVVTANSPGMHNLLATAFGPVFAAAAICLALSSLMLGLMPAKPLRGDAKT